MADTVTHPPTPHARLATGAALLAAGLLAGALFYGRANVTPAFGDVPLDVHLAYRVELMNYNRVVMQILMLSSAVALAWSAVVTRGAARALATGAFGLEVATFLVTRFGNVPINAEIKAWAAGDLPAGYQERLDVWAIFNDVRVGTAVGAFLLIIVAGSTAWARSGVRTFAGDRAGGHR